MGLSLRSDYPEQRDLTKDNMGPGDEFSKKATTTGPLRFCMITTFYPPYNFGGDGIFVHRLSNELAQRGHQVEVIHCLDSHRLLAKSKPSATDNNHYNVTVHRLKSRFGFLSPLATQQTGFPLFKASRIRDILNKGFDVIHFHNISLVGGPGILKYGEAIKLYTMHDYWLVCPTHVLFRFRQSVCAHPRCFLCTLVYKRPPQWWRYSDLLKKAAQHVDAFISLARFPINIQQKMGLHVPMTHLPPFISSPEAPTLVTELPVDKEEEKPYFLFVGRLEKLKGLQTIIPIFRCYPKAKLLIAGSGTWAEKLHNLAKGSPNIQFLDYLPYQKLKALYRKAVAVIIPSLCFEVFPLVVLEAFAEQTPVVMRNLGEMPKIIEESKGGCLYDTQEELIEAMDRLLASSSYRNELGLSGYWAYRQKWTAELHLQSYLAMIHEISTKRHDRISLEDHLQT
jgi:glycosyltransferase involved in cell wall biosynthesis